MSLEDKQELKFPKNLFLSVGVVTLVGFVSKLYQGPNAFWVNNSLSGVFYEIFWCLAVFLIWPCAKVWKIALGVLVVTCLLEFLQLWHPPFLEMIRGFFIGRALIGTYFTWSDFPYYVLGCGLGWLWMKRLRGSGHVGR